MPIQRIGKDSLVRRIDIQNGDAIARAAVVAERCSILISTRYRYLSGSIATKLLRVFHKRCFIRTPHGINMMLRSA